MDSIKKYFQFSGTISGTDYLLRNLLSSLFGFIAGFLLGMGFLIEHSMFSIFLFVLFGVIILPTIWFNLTTIYKRSLALFPELANVIVVGVLVTQVLGQIYPVISILPLIMGLILIFKNSNIENHNG